MTVQSRIRQCLNGYGVDVPAALLDLDELASEIELAVFPPGDEWDGEQPIYWATLAALGVCMNCLCTDCGCCIGCGDIDADVVGSHGFWCAL